MGSKTRLGSYCTKRDNNGVNLVTPEYKLKDFAPDPCMGSNVTHKIEMKNVLFQKNYLSKLLKNIIKRLR